MGPTALTAKACAAVAAAASLSAWDSAASCCGDDHTHFSGYCVHTQVSGYTHHHTTMHLLREAQCRLRKLCNFGHFGRRRSCTFLVPTVHFRRRLCLCTDRFRRSALCSQLFEGSHRRCRGLLLSCFRCSVCQDLKTVVVSPISTIACSRRGIVHAD
jgi:hypothetical protein